MSKHRRVNPLTLKLRELRVHRDTSARKVTTWEARPLRRFEPISAIESAFADIEIPPRCTIRRGIMRTNFTMGNRAICKGLIKRKRARSSDGKKAAVINRSGRKISDRKISRGRSSFYRFNIFLFYDWPLPSLADRIGIFLRGKCVFVYTYHCILDIFFIWSLVNFYRIPEYILKTNR